MVRTSFLTGYSIITRHNTILPAIGVFHQEKEALALVIKLYWVMPLVVLLSALADLVLVWLYERLGHPWKDIRAKETEVTE